MGTFTLKYFFKKAIWEKKTTWTSVAVMAYLEFGSGVLSFCNMMFGAIGINILGKFFPYCILSNVLLTVACCRAVQKIGYCFDRQGMYKASMMKGQSKMFADRIAEIPEGEDIWKY